MGRDIITLNFLNELKNADSEKLIENAYHTALKKYFPMGDIKTACKTDGVLETTVDFDGKLHILKLIIETKFEENFSSEVVRAKVLAQVVYYLKRFDDMGDSVPNVVLIGDKDECFVLHSNNLVGYLDLDYNWKLAPSTAGTKNIDLVEKIINNKELQEECFVFTLDENFSFEDVYNRIYDLAVNRKTQVRITERSISKVFDYFSMRVLKKNADGSSKYPPREQVELFMWLVNNTDDCYSHPKKKNTAIFGDKKNVAVNTDTFESFTRYYKFGYNAKEKKDFTAIADRLIEDSDRRRKGDFYTPSIWVDEAHKMLAENLGKDWKDEYMVWDCAWGTGNLTRDYKFWDLYCSTLEEHDLVIGKKYNEGACKFQYDFLNDDVELFDELLAKVKDGYRLTEKDFKGSKLYKSAPTLIRGLLSGKKLLFLINPPYGTATIRSKESRKNVALTKLNTIMVNEDIGACSQQLYSQFLYRIHCINELFKIGVKIGVFAKSAYMTASSFKKFRNIFCRKFKHIDGMLFQASEFADVSSQWGIDFAIWFGDKDSLDFKDIQLNNEVFDYTLKRSENGNVIDYGEKKLYNLDNSQSLSSWVKPTEKILCEDAPQFINALKWNKTPNSGKLYKNALGYLVFGGNNVYQNNQMVTLLSSCYNTGHGIQVLESNFERCMVGLVARRLITSKYATWENDKDEYLAPNIKHEKYKQWESDCIVFSLFGTGATQSSLRGIDYNGKKWDILNHFFFMSKQDMLDLALGENPNDEVYNDIQNFADDERFVYKKLQEVTLSEDAQLVLDKARELVKLSFKYRKYFASEHPEYHINTWDAGWYQIKGLCKEYMPEELKEFTKLYKEFEDRMRPLVYELGFLYK